MSKPMGAIPPGFGADDGVLTIGDRRIDALIAEAGDTPLFVYDLGLVRRALGCHAPARGEGEPGFRHSRVRHADGRRR